MIKLNILIDNLGANQASFLLIRALNEVCEHNICVTTFYTEPHKHHITPRFPTLAISDYYCQPGIGVATSIQTCYNLLKNPLCNTKIYYMWSIPWIHDNIHWKECLYIFKLIQVITYTEYAKLLESCFNIKPAIELKHTTSKSLQRVCYGLCKNES